MIQKGKLIVIEGVDGSGKATQSDKIYQKLKQEGYKVKKVAYPRYENKSSSLVKMYLNGDFGKDAKQISPYIASTFYAADRYASYKQELEEFLNHGGIVIADRYTTANMVHQAGKIHDKEERDKFLDWLWDYEFKLYGLPVPDVVFFLDIPVEYNKKLMQKRKNKDSERESKDIHERDTKHLLDSYKNAIDLVDKYNWTRINCVQSSELRTIDNIHNEIYNVVKNII